MQIEFTGISPDSRTSPVVFTGGPARPDEYPVRLTEWREYRGLTQRGLAERSGVAVTSINEIETGKRKPRISTLRRLAAALETDEWQLHNHPRDEYSAPAQLARDIDRLDTIITTLMASGAEGAGFAQFIVNRAEWFESEEADYSAESMWSSLATSLPWLVQFWHGLNRQLFERANPQIRGELAFALENWRSDWEAAGLGDIKSGMTFQVVNEKGVE